MRISPDSTNCRGRPRTCPGAQEHKQGSLPSLGRTKREELHETTHYYSIRASLHLEPLGPGGSYVAARSAGRGGSSSTKKQIVKRRRFGARLWAGLLVTAVLLGGGSVVVLRPRSALSSAQVIPEWTRSPSPCNDSPANGDDPLNSLSHCRGPVQEKNRRDGHRGGIGSTNSRIRHGRNRHWRKRFIMRGIEDVNGGKGAAVWPERGRDEVIRPS